MSSTSDEHKLGRDELSKLEIDALLEEYRQCCEDWRLRDSYAQGKLLGTALIFVPAVIGIFQVLATPFNVISLLVVSALLIVTGFLFRISMVSTIKDVAYRRGSEILAESIRCKLGTKDKIACLIRDLEEGNRLNLNSDKGRAEPNPRKVKASCADTVIRPKPLRDRAFKRAYTYSTYDKTITFYKWGGRVCLAIGILVIITAGVLFVTNFLPLSA